MIIPEIYRPEIVQKIQRYYGENLLTSTHPIIKHYLTELAEMLYSGIHSNHEYLYTEINNYHPKYLGVSISQLKEINLNLSDCQITIAREFGFKSWTEVINLGSITFNLEFEKAITYITNGDILKLSKLLDSSPNLLTESSKFGHEASLLHYVASNGIELWRQQVPSNLHEIICVLLEKGADKTATMKVYGGDFDTHTLFTSSAHPYAAGIGKEIEDLLR
jgi:hypothetical protein